MADNKKVEKSETQSVVMKVKAVLPVVRNYLDEESTQLDDRMFLFSLSEKLRLMEMAMRCTSEVSLACIAETDSGMSDVEISDYKKTLEEFFTSFNAVKTRLKDVAMRV